MIQSLGLEKSVEIIDTVVCDPIADLDVLLYVPLRNDHFLPVLLAGAARVPTLCSEIPGIQDFMTDGQEGFILPVHETKPMGELILRLVQDAAMREALAGRLQSHLSRQFSAARVSHGFGDLFFPATVATVGAPKTLDEVA
jgi:glycosyltransferase involved in cell wall biosynthesis